MNYGKLNEVIEQSGLKRSYIAKQSGMTLKTLHDRTSGISQWKTKEVEAFCNALQLDKDQRDSIFFNEM